MVSDLETSTNSPLLRDIRPGTLAYYPQTSTGNDLLAAGPDGARYTYPGFWPAGALTACLSQSGEYMRSTRTDRVVFMYDRVNSTGIPLAPEMIFAFHDAVGAYRLRGIFVWGSRPIRQASGST